MCGAYRPGVTTIEQSDVVLSELEKSLLENSIQDANSTIDDEK